MKRLLDEPTSPLEEHAASLLREVGPLEPSDVARARVRRALERRPGRGRAGGLWRLVAVIFFGAGASAAAVWGGAQLLPGFAASGSNTDSRPSEGASGARRGPARGEVAEVAAPAERAEPREAKPAATAVEGDAGSQEKPRSAAQSVAAQSVAAPGVAASSAAPPGPTVRQSAARATPAQSAQSAPSASDAVLVQQAIEALRNDGDADRATELLEKYRRKGQNQALSEEALALSIEAALVGDPARAKRLAQQYLRTYPSGRFKQLAERAVGR